MSYLKILLVGYEEEGQRGVGKDMFPVLHMQAG